MPKKDYKWKRFWCPRSGRINLADDGYLCDPDGEWGRAYNPDLVSLEAIAEIPCLVLLGEPGIGKSQELENLKALTKNNSSQVLELNLRSCTNLKEDLFRDETFTNWLGGNYHLYLFLDSLDEGLLSIPTLATALIDELRKPKYQNHINRLHLRLACRTFVFPEILEEELKEIWKEANFETYELAPLRRVDVSEAAKAEGFSSDDFLKEIDQKDIVPLAIKPITLRFLLNTYRRHSSQFLSNQRLHELYLEGCKVLCEEINESRRGSNRIGNLDAEQRLIVAARIAAVTIFTNRFAIWTGIDQGDIPAEDIFLQKLYFGCEKANGREVEVTREAIKEVLDTGLFSSRGLHRMGWAHQTYAEFLAAWYLTQHETSLAQIENLIFSSEDLDQKLIPQLHETAAWLTSMRLDVLQEIIKTDPDVLLQTDVPSDAEIRESIVENLLTQYEEGKLFDRDGNCYRNYAKLQHPRLVEQLRPYICDSNKQIEARDLAIDIAEVCEVSELQEELVNLALDSSQSIYLRVSAAKSLCSIGDAGTRLKLKPLAIEKLPEDKDDRLKGYALKAIWSDHLTATELFHALPRPKTRNFFGGYQWFLRYELTSKLQPSDLGVALNWLERQGLRCLGHPLRELGDTILFKAWENFDLPGVAESFTQVALVQWREYQEIITHDNKLQEQFSASLLRDTRKRHTLIEQAVLSISRTEEDPYFLSSSLTDNILVSEDIFWMLEKLQTSSCEKMQRIWVKLIHSSFNRQDVKQIDAIIVATQANTILQKIFAPDFLPIEIDSVQADNLRADHLREQEMQGRRKKTPLLDPPPKERVLQLLEKLEVGDLSAWWKLNLEMTLKPESRYYDNESELDLTRLPGWHEADEATQRRIIEGAKKYVQQQDDVDYSWIGTNTLDRPALAGCRAFLLLLQESPYFLENLPSEIWQRWASVIVAAPSSNQDKELYLELVKYAYLNAPEEFIKTLITLINKENQGHDYLFVIDRLDKCWDHQLKLTLLEKVQDPLLKPKCVGQLLQELLKQGLAEAGDFAESLITSPLPSSENEREKSLIAARVLIESSNISSWSFIWALIQQDSSFGREVLELVAYPYSDGIQLNLTESQLTNLYIWLVHQYPYDEDPDHSNEAMEYSVTARDCIARLRNSVLSQLEERGTSEACAEIKRLIQELPHITWLGKTLIDAQANMRRKTWQPPTPEEFLQLVNKQQLNQFQGVTNVSNFNFDQRGATIGVNVANEGSNIKFIQHARQNINISEQDLAESAQKIQALLNQLAQAYPITTEQQQTFIQKFLEQIESTPDLIQVFLAGGIEGLKILCPPVGIPIEVLRRIYEVVKERHNKA
jgi:predicted NACHT family NTPase